MSIPEIINLGFVSFPSYYVLFGLALIVCTFVVWRESTRDGFDNERVFDLYFGLIALLIGIKYVIAYYAPYKLFIGTNRDKLLMFVFVVLSLLLIHVLGRLWKWSTYRMLDIYSALLFVFFSYMFGMRLQVSYSTNSLLLLIAYAFVYMVLFLSRKKMLSGIVFSLFLIITALIGQAFFNDSVYLLFYFLLITISMVNLISRIKKTMTSGKLDLNFLKKIKENLIKKNQRLKAEQQKLIDEDPYLAEGRTEGNAEAFDEAILEDQAKTESDIKKGNIEDMQEQVEEALEKINEGTYGICDTCGLEIDPARLEIYPEATKCVKCENRSEQGDQA